jgi:hypothetical protein
MADVDFSVQWDWDDDGFVWKTDEQLDNEDFSSGETGWSFFGDIVHSVSGGKLQVYRNGTDAATFYQTPGFAVEPGTQIFIAFAWENTSSTAKEFTIFVRNAASYDDAYSETFYAHTGMSRVQLMFTTLDVTWASTLFEVAILTNDNDAALEFDYFSLKYSSPHDDITPYVIEAQIDSGFTDPLAHIADIGRMILTLDNTDQRFSPDNASSPYNGKQWINAPVRVQMSVDDGPPQTIWRGWTVAIEPAAGAEYGTRRTTVLCEDIFGVYSRAPLSLPMQTNVTMENLLNLIGAEVFSTDRATGTITFSDVPTDGDTITVGDDTYTMRSTINASYDVLIGTDADECGRNLAAAINDDPDAGLGTTLYPTGTLKSRSVSASNSSGTVTVTALARGTLGNSIVLSENASNCTVSGATLSGGTDGPSGLTDYESGKRTFDYAADTWHEDRTNALRAIQDVVESEFGYAWVAHDGSIVTWDKDREFELPAETVTLDVDDNQITGMSGDIGSYIFNRSVVSFNPRTTETDQIIASAGNVLAIPGTTFGTRWNRSVSLPNSGGGDALDAGVRIIRLPFVESTTGNVVGASDVITPRAGTDYTVNDRRDGSGYDYSDGTVLGLSIVVTGSGVECSFSNTALGTLYVIDFEVRGTALIGYNQQQIVREDATSIGEYQLRALPYMIPLPSGENFAEQIAYYLVGRYKDPAYRPREIHIRDATEAIGGTVPLTVEIGQTVRIVESQTAIDQKFIVRGFNLRVLNGGTTTELKWRVKRIDDTTYWLLGDATYGVLGTTTRLGL